MSLQSVRLGWSRRRRTAATLRASLWEHFLRFVPRAAAPGPQPVADGRRLLGTEDRTRWLYRLSPEGRAFRERVKSLLAEPLFAPREGLTSEQQAELSYSRFRRVRDELDLRVRDVEQRPARLAAALGLIGPIDGTLFTVMSIHYCLCGGSLLRHGTAPEIQAYIDELDALESIGTFLVTELGYGNNAVALETRADYDPERRELVLSTPSPKARKFMPNTGLNGVPKLGVVMARLFVAGRDHGVFPVVVRLRTTHGDCPGVSITALGDKPSYALDNAITSFDAVRVPKHNLLLGTESSLSDAGEFSSSIASRRERFLLSLEQVQLGRLCLSSVAVTATGASAFLALNYAAQRTTFAPRQRDVPVLEYRNHQRDVFSCLAHAYAGRCLVDFALDELVSSAGDAHDYSFRITSATKAHVTYATERWVRICRERCGAAGLLEENRLSVYACQSQGLITAEGDNQIVLLKVARQMLLEQGYTAVGKQRLADTAPEDPERLLALLLERERRLLDELRRAMVPAWLPGVDLFRLWNDNVNLALETASAHASRLAAQAFWARVEPLGEDPSALLFELFALSELAPHLGFYLAEELLTRSEVRHFGQRIDGVCAAIRPHALTLAGAVDVPNSLLRAPLGSEDYVACYDQRARPLNSRSSAGA